MLADVTPGMPAFDEETFGPVAAVIRVDDDDEAVALANATPYGLGASIWTRDAAHALAAGPRGSRPVRVFINADGGVRPAPALRRRQAERLRPRARRAPGPSEFTNIRTVLVG